MCGRCREVFNAFQSLSRVEEPIEAPVVEDNAQRVLKEYNRPADEAQATSAIAHSTPEAVADSLFLREEPLPLPAAFSATDHLPREPFAPAIPLENPDRGPADLPLADAPHAHEATEPPAIQPQADAVRPDEPAIDLSYDDNLLLVEAPPSRGTPAVPSSRGWSAGAFLLLVALLAQAGYSFRTTLVSTYPQLRPTVNHICEFAGCTLSWGREEAALKIEASELIEAPGKAGRILLTAILVNRGKTKQDMPSLELRLTDNANQVVASRLLHPADYLGRDIGKDEGLVPNTEHYVNLNLELTNKTLASGYGLIVYYP